MVAVEPAREEGCKRAIRGGGFTPGSLRDEIGGGHGGQFDQVVDGAQHRPLGVTLLIPRIRNRWQPLALLDLTEDWLDHLLAPPVGALEALARKRW